MGAVNSGLALCSRGTLGKGTLRTYPSWRVPTVVVRFDDGENAAEFVFKAIDGFGSYDTVQAAHFVPEIDERFVRSR